MSECKYEVRYRLEVHVRGEVHLLNLTPHDFIPSVGDLYSARYKPPYELEERSFAGFVKGRDIALDLKGNYNIALYLD